MDDNHTETFIFCPDPPVLYSHCECGNLNEWIPLSSGGPKSSFWGCKACYHKKMREGWVLHLNERRGICIKR